MTGLLDFYVAIAIAAGCLIPVLLVAWAIEMWWVSLPDYKRRRIMRKLGAR